MPAFSFRFDPDFGFDGSVFGGLQLGAVKVDVVLFCALQLDRFSLAAESMTSFRLLKPKRLRCCVRYGSPPKKVQKP